MDERPPMSDDDTASDGTSRLDDIEAEAEALTAISRAMGPMTPKARKRVADWAKSISDGDPGMDALVVVARELTYAKEAVKRHRAKSDAMTKADAMLYVAVLGHERVGSDVLTVLYAPGPPAAPETGATA